MRISCFLLFLFLSSCDSADMSNQKQRKRNNLVTEKIYRNSNEYFYKEDAFCLAVKEIYPWLSKSKFKMITMNAFRCRGSKKHPSRSVNRKLLNDCNGLHDHGLPYMDGEEFVYPVLINLLNYVQDNLDSEVIVVSGHRCPKHHSYVTNAKSRLSRHMIGARVDFYVKGFETSTEKVIDVILDFYKEDEKRYQKFSKVIQGDGKSTFTNKEIRITLRSSDEAKLLDHVDHDMITLEAIYDRIKDTCVILEWDKAYKGYIRN